MNPTLREMRLEGTLIGTAVGDSVGLPFEGMTRDRVRRFLGQRPLEHRFLLGRGLVSDDTQHSCMVAQALLAAQGDPEAFARSLAWQLRLWLLGAPAGIGWATLRAIVKLWCGFGPRKSGVRSAGNGPAMRSAILGAFVGDDPDRLRTLVATSTRITHTDRRAFDGALAIATAAGMASVHEPQDLDPKRILDVVVDRLDPGEMADLIAAARRNLAYSPDAFAAEIGAAKGVSGFVNQTVPMALHCWARHPTDARVAVTEIVALGGDTDSTGAIVGGLVGAACGVQGLPRTWIDGLSEWPRSVDWMRALARRLASGETTPPAVFWPALPLRNALFLCGIVRTLCRRAFPPY